MEEDAICEGRLEQGSFVVADESSVTTERDFTTNFLTFSEENPGLCPSFG